MSLLIGSIALATVLWGVMFGLKWGNFWVNMTVAASLLAGIALCAQGRVRRAIFHFRPIHLALGIGSAAILYAIFFIGDRASAWLLPFAREQVGGIYAMKAQMSPLLVGIVLFFIIGPAEEVFWRGFVQDRLSGRYGDRLGWLAGGLIDAGVHFWAWNFMLCMAALVCGLFWGEVYRRWKSLWPGIISHAVWDVMIFVVLPVR